MMRKVVSIILMSLLLISNLSGIFAIDNGSKMKQSNLNFTSNNVGVLEGLSKDGKNFNIRDKQMITLDELNINERVIEIKGIYTDKKTKTSTPFHLECELFRSADQQNLYVGSLNDVLGNFQVVHFSIDEEHKNNSIQTKLTEKKNLNSNFRLKRQFGDESIIDNSSDLKGKSLVNLYLMDTNRNLIYMEEALNSELQLPNFEALEVVESKEELWHVKILEPVAIVEFEYNNIEGIDKKLQNFNNLQMKKIMREDMKQNLTKKDSNNFSILNLNNGAEQRTFGTWYTIGDVNYYDRINLKFGFDYPSTFFFSYTSGDYLISEPRASITMTSTTTTGYNSDYSQIVSESSTTAFMVGRELTFDNGVPQIYIDRDIEMRMMVGDGSKDKFVEAQVPSYTMATYSSTVRWSSIIDYGISLIPYASSAYSLFQATTGTVTINSGTINSKFFTTTHSSDVAKDTVTVAAPGGAYMKAIGHNMGLSTKLSSTRSIDTRPIAAQYRYFIGHSGSSSFTQEYKLVTIQKQYSIQ